MSDHSKRYLLGMKPSAYRTCRDENLTSLVPVNTDKNPKVISCDTEDDSKGNTIMVNFFDGENHFTFRHTEAAVEWLIKYSREFKKGVVVWFANTQYDIGNLFRESQEYLSFTLSGSRFISGKVFQERIKFKDVFNVIPGSSVKSLGKMIGLEKIESHGVFDNEEYCQRDTEIVYWSVLKFENTLKKLNVQMKNTAASTGFMALIKAFDKLSYNILSEDDHEFMKQGYYGGRTEVFHTAKISGKIWGYDIVSSYPNAMTKIPLVDTASKIYTKNPKLYTREGFSDCLVEAPEKIEIPYLPLKKDGKLIFPVGTFRGVWTYFELREAQRLGYKILKHFRSVEFKVNYNFTLADFVFKFFKVKADSKEMGDLVLSYAAKIILNASYGKFAMGNEKTELVAFEEFHNIKGHFVSEVFPNNQIIVKRKTKYAPTTNFMTASMITAYGRHDLYKQLLRANSDERTLLYCDTDSVFFHGNNLDFSIGKHGALGSLGLEYELKEAHFVLPKTYFIRTSEDREIYKCKGVRGELAREFFTKGYAESMQPLKYVETCRKNFFISERNKKFGTNESLIPFNVWIKKPKTFKSTYDKRIKTRNGKTQAVSLEYDVETQKYIE